MVPENGGFSLELMVPEDREFSLEIGEGSRSVPSTVPNKNQASLNFLRLLSLWEAIHKCACLLSPCEDSNNSLLTFFLVVYFNEHACVLKLYELVRLL